MQAPQEEQTTADSNQWHGQGSHGPPRQIPMIQLRPGIEYVISGDPEVAKYQLAALRREERARLNAQLMITLPLAWLAITLAGRASSPQVPASARPAEQSWTLPSGLKRNEQGILLSPAQQGATEAGDTAGESLPGGD